MIRPGQLTMLGVLGILCGSAVVSGHSFGSDDPATPAFEPTESYEARQVEGWTLLISGRFLKTNPELADQTLKLLQTQLYQVARRLSPRALTSLRTIRIWVEELEPHHPCMAYHPDAGWLKSHGMNPDKARGVELANARNFLNWTFDQPWMVFHELAHGYHDQFLANGFDNPEVKKAFDHARDLGLYQAVLRMGGSTEKAYATTNPMEYFAEGSEAYFGTNDFFPFVRPELKRHDPKLFAVLGKLWDAKPDGQP